MAEIQEKASSGKGGKKRAKKHSTKIDMTPMVDLAALLITFFMLTTTFSKPQTMEINMPVKDDKPENQIPVKASNAMTIILGEDDKVFYYFGLGAPEENPEVIETDYSAAGIRKALVSPRVKSNPKMTVMIKPLETSRYKNMVDILDELRITDTKKFALVDITDTDKQLVKTKLGQ
ncbi:biopolymer transporter ExbD [Pontibacter sp. BT310]|jgi:biopolymer transport protein ExbD|uniref:Biopolymer transporter ExbD n=1 Tax=Pontibacter populi TaxID=890055 RepID=A0ABS6XFG7_9BACT|nr:MULTISPECIES: biopolymer transporter ExbD [Pontibacter]MBJ6119886.1 biopolymer transporter ExbD [Pontibacter sp. BT310]MBR0572315.1 biopolymer transporter ExbD [Microvirga sp. STS03]MBW3366739.1 biopolymer transporter ExbD [Pontibacter populi]